MYSLGHLTRPLSPHGRSTLCHETLCRKTLCRKTLCHLTLCRMR